MNSGLAFAWTVLMESDSHRLASCTLSSCEPACTSIVAVHARLQTGHVINLEIDQAFWQCPVKSGGK